MNCPEVQELLQRRLDGDPLSDSPELERHLSECSPCREQFAAAGRLLDGMKSVSRPKPPAGMPRRIAIAVLEDRRSRQRQLRVRFLVTAALAASVLIMALAGYFWLPHTDEHDKHPPVVEHKNPDAVPELAKSMDDARIAVKSLTERIAGQTKDQAKMILAAANPLEIVSVPAAPATGDATQPLIQAGQGLTEGLQPVTRTTRRALEFFVREAAALDVGQN